MRTSASCWRGTPRGRAARSAATPSSSWRRRASGSGRSIRRRSPTWRRRRPRAGSTRRWPGCRLGPTAGAGSWDRPSRPVDLEDRLIAAGLQQVSDSAGMALDMDDRPGGAGGRAGEPLPAGLAIEPVVDAAGLDRWRTVQQRGLGLDDEATEAWFVAHRRPGFDPALPLRNWVASLDGVAVAAAALFVGAGVAGHLQRLHRARGPRPGDRRRGDRGGSRRGRRARVPAGRPRVIGDGLPRLPAARLPGRLAPALVCARLSQPVERTTRQPVMAGVTDPPDTR